MNISGNSPEELRSLASFDQLYFPSPWTTEQWLELNFHHHLIFTLGRSELEGLALFHRVTSDETAHLLKICLLPEARGSGVAIDFWEEILQDLRSKSVKSIFLEVEITNLRAIGFYRKMGFERLRLIKRFYSDGADAFTMQLML
jgi:ribosomal protein S18 acetylase RimI-like enzyme